MKIDENSNIDRNYLHLLNDLRNFNKILRKDGTYDDIKSHKKPGFTLSLEDLFFEKRQGLSNLTPPSSRFRVKTSMKMY